MINEVFFAVPCLRRFDATGDYLLAQADLFRSKGFTVHLCAKEIHPTVNDEAHDYEYLRDRASEDDLVIYHYGIYDEGYELICSSRAKRKLLYYHNQTPPEYFESHDQGTADALRRGLRQIAHADKNFSKLVANSPYTIAQQKSRRVLADAAWFWLPPLISDHVQFETFELGAREYTFCVLSRMVPHKMTHKAIKLFRAYKMFDPSARMAVIGSGQGAYYDECKSMIDNTPGIDHFSEISDSQRQKVLTSSKALLNLSAHEGFALPVIEAMSVGCIPFYGASIWLHSMINCDDLRLAVDDDVEFAAYLVHEVLAHRAVEVFQMAAKNVGRFSPQFKKDYQFSVLSQLGKIDMVD